MRLSRIAALLLAAGNASRYGSLKQLLPIDGIPLVRRSAMVPLAAGLPTWVVVGADSDQVVRQLDALPLQIVDNAGWSAGMGGSIALGIRALLRAQADTEAVLILLADQALVDTEDLHALCAAHAAEPGAIIAADHGEAVGPPCLFPRGDFAALSALSGAAGARGLLNEQAARLRRLPLPHARFDIDTPADLQALLRRAGA